MRTRSTFPPPEKLHAAWKYEVYRTTWITSSSGGSDSQAFPFSGSVITDEGGPMRFVGCGAGRYKAMKAVSQKKFHDTWSSTGHILYTNTAGTARYNGMPLWFPYAAGGGYLGVGSTLFSHEDIMDPRVYSGDFFDRAKPTMSTRANMTVFLYELRDLKKMWDILPHRHFRLSNWKEVFKYVNGLHLNWSFGWKPFLADIKNVFKGLSTFEKRLTQFIHEQEKTLRRHTGNPKSTTSTSSNYYRGNLHVYETRTTEEEASATFLFSYWLPAYNYEELRFRAMLDTLGLAATPSNIWAIIPWSFVVDWFVDIGGYLQRYENDWVEPWVSFCQGCYSWKKKISVNYNGSWDKFYSPFSAPIGDCGAEWYVRATGKPTSGITTSSLNADKIRLLASLVGQYLV